MSDTNWYLGVREKNAYSLRLSDEVSPLEAGGQAGLAGMPIGALIGGGIGAALTPAGGKGNLIQRLLGGALGGTIGGIGGGIGSLLAGTGGRWAGEKLSTTLSFGDAPSPLDAGVEAGLAGIPVGAGVMGVPLGIGGAAVAMRQARAGGGPPRGKLLALLAGGGLGLLAGGLAGGVGTGLAGATGQAASNYLES